MTANRDTSLSRIVNILPENPLFTAPERAVTITPVGDLDGLLIKMSVLLLLTLYMLQYNVLFRGFSLKMGVVRCRQ